MCVPVAYGPSQAALRTGIGVEARARFGFHDRKSASPGPAQQTAHPDRQDQCRYHHPDPEYQTKIFPSDSMSRMARDRVSAVASPTPTPMIWRTVIHPAPGRTE